MSSPDEHNIILSPKPLEVKLADVLFIAVRKHLTVFKDLTASKYVHYTMVMNGSLIDFHKTLEDQGRHIPLLKIEFDWQFVMERVIREIWASWQSIFQIVKTNDPRWEDLEIEFIPIQVLEKLLQPIMKGARWNVDLELLEKLENSFEYARLGQMVNYGSFIGNASQGKAEYFVLSNGTDCVLFDTSKISKIIEKSFKRSIRKIHLNYYTLGSLLFYVKIRLLIFVNLAIKRLRKFKT